ncbi:MAG: hypothetical protein ACXWXR_10115 [Candidatus Limnocylindrales bacterium]
MAVYEGARPRTIALPRAPRLAEGPTLGRRRARTAVRAGRRSNHLGFVLGVIVVSFLLAFFWLAQVVRESATGYDIGRLEVVRSRLDAREQDLRSDLSRLGHEPAIRKLALDYGLGQLGDPIVLPAR